MKKEMLKDFIRYAKEQFGYDIVLENVSNPDTFRSIFDVSFLEYDTEELSMKEGINALEYINDSVKVAFNYNDETVECSSMQDMELAA